MNAQGCIRQQRGLSRTLECLVFCCVMWLLITPIGAQRKSARARPPEFPANAFQGVFFEDVASALRGSPPSPSKRRELADRDAPDNPEEGASSPVDAEGSLAWRNIISPTSLEDLVKGSKLRLDRIVTTPSAFAGGGHRDARTEFSLQALMFAIIESYPERVRWQASAGLARERMSRMASDAKSGSREVFDAAKQRLLDLSDLLNGSQLAGEPNSEVDWASVIERPPLMRLLEWAHRDHVSWQATNEEEFRQNGDELIRYAELVAALGRASLQEGMPDATDHDYIDFATDMILQAQRVRETVEIDNADLARRASRQLGQSCANCHDYFR